MARGRKKKIVEQIPTTTTIKYEGTVQVSLLKGNKTISKKTCHNRGKGPLFQSIGHCLVGDYQSAELTRPKYLALFSAGNKGAAAPTTDTAVKTILDNITNYRTSTPIIYQGTPLRESFLENDSEYSNDEERVTIKFMIPFTQLTSTADINLFCLYGYNNQANTTNPSAYFLLTDSTTPTILDTLIPASITLDADYSLYIQWTLKITE